MKIDNRCQIDNRQFCRWPSLVARGKGFWEIFLSYREMTVRTPESIKSCILYFNGHMHPYGDQESPYGTCITRSNVTQDGGFGIDCVCIRVIRFAF